MTILHQRIVLVPTLLQRIQSINIGEQLTVPFSEGNALKKLSVVIICRLLKATVMTEHALLKLMSSVFCT